MKHQRPGGHHTYIFKNDCAFCASPVTLSNGGHQASRIRFEQQGRLRLLQRVDLAILIVKPFGFQSNPDSLRKGANRLPLAVRAEEGRTALLAYQKQDA